MTKEEALKLALDAFGEIAWSNETQWQRDRAKEAITTIKEALAQPEQEPVAFVKGCNRGQWEIFPAKAYQIFEREQPLYTTPPQRKPLTDEQLKPLIQKAMSYYGHNPDSWHLTAGAGFCLLARAIEAAHGIKGGA